MIRGGRRDSQSAGPAGRTGGVRFAAPRAAAAIAGVSAAMLAAGLAAVIAVAVVGVDAARTQVARTEARMAASLWELADGGAAAVDEFLGSRAAIRAVEDAASGPGAFAYRPGELDAAARIEVDPELAGAPPSGPGAPPPGPASPRLPLPATLIALLASLSMAAWASRRRHSPTIPALLATASLALVAVLAHGWSEHAIDHLNAALAAQGRRAVEIAARAGADSGPVRLALLGHGEIAPPGTSLVATAAGAALAAWLTLALLPLAARPRALRRTLAAWGFLAPAALLLLCFTVGPLLFSLWISLHEWHLVDPSHPFTGLANYREVLLDADWWSAIRNTAVFTLHVPAAMALALALALLTQGSTRAVRWVRLALFLPGITSVVAIAIVWKWLLNDGHGLANQALERIGVGPVAWLTSPDAALASLMLIGVWMVVGYQMVVFQAGLAAIPRDWHDAARVDGAGAVQRFRHVTLPGLRHTLFFVLVTSVIGSFQLFGLVYVMTEGGPLGATDVAVYHIYREAWEFLRFGSAAAMSWVLFAVVFIATWLHFRFLEGGRAHA